MKKPISFTIALFAFFLHTTCRAQQAPPLGTVADYALFTGNGAFINVGSSVMKGNIGTNNGPITGFPPGFVTGVTNRQNPASAQATADATTAFQYLDTLTCNQPIVTLSGDITFVPGFYCMGAAANINGVIKFDAQNVPNSIFIVKVGGALSLSSNAIIKYMNGASPKNIYWQVNGLLSLASNANFAGTALVDGAITTGFGSNITGRAISLIGEINAESTTITVPSDVNLLPIVMASFTAEKSVRNAVLKWTTATETNSKYFMVERSTNAALPVWKTLATIAAKGNSNIAASYSWSDFYAADGPNYYRLKMVDQDGSFTFSNINVLNFDKANATAALQAFPNPATNFFSVIGAQEGTSIKIVDMTGKILMKQQAVNGTNVLVTTYLQKGIYLCNVIIDNQLKSIKLIKE